MNRTDTKPPASATGLLHHACRVAALVAVVLLAAACASRQPVAASIEERAQARWDALLAGDIDTAYQYLSPGYRSSHSRVDYEVALRSRRMAWTAASVLESQCQGDACTVVAKVGYRIPAPVPGVPKWESERRLKERWVRTEGQWWFVPDS